MRKYLNYIAFSMMLFLTLCFSVSALDCYYIKDYGDLDGDEKNETLNAHFRINENTNELVFSGVSGYFEATSDHKIVHGETQSVENWNKKFHPLNESKPVSGFRGDEYYNDNKKCPRYAILVDRSGQFDLVVSDERNKQFFLNYGAQKQGIEVMELTKTDANTLVRYPSSCLGLNQASCNNNENFACVWVDSEKYDFLDKSYCNVDNLLYVSCGGASDIPMQVPSIISMLVNLLKIATPIILIVISMITLVKALSAGKEDEIKKATSSLVKKMIAAALVFFVVAIVQFVISKVAEDETDYKNFGNCLDCFLNNSCSDNMYYKTVISGQEWCTPVSTGKSDLCEK